MWIIELYCFRWSVRSEVGLGLLYCFYSRDAPQIGALVFCTVISVHNPSPIIALISTSLSSNVDLQSYGSSMRTIKLREKKNIFSLWDVLLISYWKRNSCKDLFPWLVFTIQVVRDKLKLHIIKFYINDCFPCCYTIYQTWPN